MEKGERWPSQGPKKRTKRPVLGHVGFGHCPHSEMPPEKEAEYAMRSLWWGLIGQGRTGDLGRTRRKTGSVEQGERLRFKGVTETKTERVCHTREHRGGKLVDGRSRKSEDTPN